MFVLFSISFGLHWAIVRADVRPVASNFWVKLGYTVLVFVLFPVSFGLHWVEVRPVPNNLWVTLG